MSDKIEVYIYTAPPDNVFLGKGQFVAMPRIGERVFPVGSNGAFAHVVDVVDWNYNNDLTWEGITIVHVTLEPSEEISDQMKMK